MCADILEIVMTAVTPDLSYSLYGLDNVGNRDSSHSEMMPTDGHCQQNMTWKYALILTGEYTASLFLAARKLTEVTYAIFVYSVYPVSYTHLTLPTIYSV